MPIHLEGATVDPGSGPTVPLDTLADALGWKVEQLGGGRFGLCPEPDVCINLPEDAVRDGALMLTATPALDSLGLIAVGDSVHTVVERAAAAAGLGPGDLVDVTLPDVNSGQPTPLARPGRPTAMYAWASW